jgi:hypothetical protein
MQMTDWRLQDLEGEYQRYDKLHYHTGFLKALVLRQAIFKNYLQTIQTNNAATFAEFLRAELLSQPDRGHLQYVL